jgi:hypothetical protein
MLTYATPYKQFSHWQDREVKIINGYPVRFSDVCVHEFLIGDVDDPELHAAEPLQKWQTSAAAAWVFENAVGDPYRISQPDLASYGHHYKIMARLSEQNETFWRLKWSGI